VTPPSLFAEQLRVATALYQEAVRKGALFPDASSTSLDAQLAATTSSPMPDALLAWARNFRNACIGAVPPRQGQPPPADEHIEIAALAVALEHELAGDFRGSVYALGVVLIHQRRLEADEVYPIERAREPSAEELRTVLVTWIARSGAWGGPVLGWMRDLHDRLEAQPPRETRHVEVAEPPVTPHSTAPGDDTRGLSDRPPPPVEVVAAPESDSAAPPPVPSPVPDDEWPGRAKTTLAFTVIDRVFLVAYGTDSPTDEDWIEYLAELLGHGIDRTMQIIVSDGGAPTWAQSRELNRLVAGRKVPIAVLSQSAQVRGLVTVLSWFNRKIKAFPPYAIREAMAYLEIPSTRTDLIERELGKLQAEVREGSRLP
jgi:hypothetical protein